MSRPLLFFGALVFLCIALLVAHSLFLKANSKNTMRIESEAFGHGGQIPAQFTCDGENVSPSFSFAGVPKEARSLVLIMDDPDAPAGLWVHWLVWNISVVTKTIGEGGVPAKATEGMTSFGATSYGGPCPPDGEHRYFFKLYALDTELELPKETTKDRLEEAMTGHVLDKAELIGLYSR